MCSTYWDICPSEILYMIFKYLNHKSLINCMAVSRRWCSIAADVGRSVGWQNVVVNGLPDAGACFRKKSHLNWGDIVFNVCLWHSVNSSKIESHHTYEDEEITDIHIYKGNIIVIYITKVTYYDMETHEIIKSFPVPYIDFDENDFMLAALSHCSKNIKRLTLSAKQYPSSTWKDMCPEAFTVLSYKLHNNCCYVSTDHNCLFLITLYNGNLWDLKLVARYYGHGLISDINVYNQEVFLMLDWGGLLQVDRGGLRFKIGFNFDIPKCASPMLFQNSGAVVSVATDETFQYRRQDSKYWVLECPGLTCSLQHGEILILGYWNGTVQILIPQKLRETCTPVPELILNVQDLGSYQDEKDIAVRKLEISESRRTQNLFIVTRTNIHQVKLVYPPDMEKFILDLC